MNTISPYNQQLGNFLEIVELCDIYLDCDSLKHNFDKCKRFINIISLSGYTELMILVMMTNKYLLAIYLMTVYSIILFHVCLFNMSQKS